VYQYNYFKSFLIHDCWQRSGSAYYLHYLYYAHSAVIIITIIIFYLFVFRLRNGIKLCKVTHLPEVYWHFSPVLLLVAYCELLTVPFNNNHADSKFKAQQKNAFLAAINQMFGRSFQLPTYAECVVIHRLAQFRQGNSARQESEAERSHCQTFDWC